ncbi:MAG: hypothetical protein M0P49_00590 [Bacilli bacterium]|nr:hypothetical protein [Bacilli bacterium]
MLCLNTECEIKTKVAQGDGNEYGYVQFGNGNDLFFLPCSIKKFDTINTGFHTKLSIGKSKAGNPKIVYTPDDKDLYMLIKTNPNQELYIPDIDLSKIELVKSTIYLDEDGEITVALIKILEDVELTLVDDINITYISIKNKYVKYIDDATGVPMNLISIVW